MCGMRPLLPLRQVPAPPEATAHYHMCNYIGVIMTAEHWKRKRKQSFSRIFPTRAEKPMHCESVRGDITTFAVDAIVNAANESLRRGSGVCGAIFAAAGPGLEQACDAIGHCPTGHAVATGGFALPSPWIIHAVGPVWHGGEHGEADLLASCYRRSLKVADEIGARSVAFPAISTGIYGFPADEAAEIAVRTIVETDCSVEKVLLVAFDDATSERYRRLLRINWPGGP
jgi:O-acetyl-ADP-ribose deacetylase